LSNCAPNQSALILACDLPFLTPELLALLIRIHLGEDQSDPTSGPPPGINVEAAGITRPRFTWPPQITWPEDQNGRVQPLAGIYTSSCLPAVEELLAEDLLRITGLIGRVSTRTVLFREVAHLPRAERFFLNLNTPNDLSAVRS
jgi:molybdopterin-guanine dinucleotide biosynthesis protein A